MKPPTLLEVQRWMKDRIRPGLSGPAADTGTDVLNPQGGDPGTERLSVYAAGYPARIEEALKETYESIRHVIGVSRFHQLAQDYAGQYPSHDYSLDRTGAHLSEFLSGSALLAKYPFLADLARLEWQVRQAFHAFQKPPLDPPRLKNLSLDDWSRTRVVFQPAVSVLRSEWPVLDIWKARKLPIKEVNIDLVDRPQAVLIYRAGLEVVPELISTAEYRMLEGLLADRFLGELCEEFAASGVDGKALTEWFSRWNRNGLLVDLELVRP